jgi:hypothetical protein
MHSGLLAAAFHMSDPCTFCFPSCLQSKSSTEIESAYTLLALLVPFKIQVAAAVFPLVFGLFVAGVSCAERFSFAIIQLDQLRRDSMIHDVFRVRRG